MGSIAFIWTETAPGRAASPGTGGCRFLPAPPIDAYGFDAADADAAAGVAATLGMLPAEPKALHARRAPTRGDGFDCGGGLGQQPDHNEPDARGQRGRQGQCHGGFHPFGPYDRYPLPGLQLPEYNN